MAPGLLFRTFLKVYRKRILREAYIGILGREPDTEGLDAHAARLGRNGDLAPVLAEMSQSDEACKIALRKRAEQTVQQLCDALRGGESGAADLDGLTQRLVATLDVGAVAAALASGPEHWRKMIRSDPGMVIDAAFNSLLKRQPDLEGLATYTKLLNRTGDLTAFLGDLSASQECRAVFLAQVGPSQNAEPDRSTPTNFSVEEIVAAAYVALLGRAPDDEGLAAYSKQLQEGGTVADFLAAIDRSTEHRKRLLLRRD